MQDRWWREHVEGAKIGNEYLVSMTVGIQEGEKEN